jgi:PAS domain S-box-containing protein
VAGAPPVLRRPAALPLDLADALSRAPLPAAVLDAQGRLLWAGDALLALVGRTRDSALGRSVREIGLDVRPEGDPLGGAAGPTTRRVRFRCGRRAAWARGVRVPLAAGHDLLLGLDSDTGSDTGEAGHDLREAARAWELFETFMRHAPVAAFIRDAEGRYLFANPAYGHAHRLDPAEVVGRSVDEVAGGAAAAEEAARDREVLAGGRPVRESRTFVRGEGSAVGHRFPLPGPAGRTAVGGVFLEVSESRRLRQAARDAEQRFLEIFQHTGLPIAVFDVGGHLLDANVAYTRLLGAPLSRITGRHLRSLVTGTTFAQDTPKWRKLVAGGQRSYRTAAAIRREDGSVVVTPCTISIVRAADGRPKYVYSVNDPGGYGPGPSCTGLPPLDLEELSPSEHVILTTLARGDTLSDAGAELHLSRAGVDHHLSRLRQRLGLPRGTRTAGLVARAYALGVLAPGSWPPQVAMPVAPR